MFIKRISRRQFLQNSVLKTVGSSLLFSSNILQSCKKKENKRHNIHLGFIGLGAQAIYLLNHFIRIDGVRVVAGVDVYQPKRVRFHKFVREFYGAKGETSAVDVYDNYRNILLDDNVDAVIIATPVHWHALIAIEACQAGKDIYLETPLTFTVYEGQELIKAVRKHKRILQVGGQQRSDKNTQHAVRMIQEGRLGELEKIKIHVPSPPKTYDLPLEPVPPGLNWDRWLGPLSASIHYNKALNPPILLDPVQDEQFSAAWRHYKEMSNGMSDWGFQMFDVIQWALNKDGSGPVKVIPKGVNGATCLTYIYDNGISALVEVCNRESDMGIEFHGKTGSWLHLKRDSCLTSDSSLLLPEDQKSKKTDIQIAHSSVFIDAIRSRKDPNVPVEVGHSACSMCVIGNIACELEQALDWDPKAQKFTNSERANIKLHYKYRDNYNIGNSI